MTAPGRPSQPALPAHPDATCRTDCSCSRASTPAAPGDWADGSGCSGAEPFALRVLGDDMAPEFHAGDIVIIEPDGAIGDGRFVLARVDDEWVLRQLRRRGQAWVLQALNQADGASPELPLHDLADVKGVVIQKAVPGRRRLSRFYV